MVHVKQRRDNGDFPDRITDIHFLDQMRDPVAGIQKAYAKVGRTVGDTHAKRIQDYLDNKPKGKFGKHAYQPEDWGFTKAGIREQTKVYVDAYGVELED